MTKIKEIYFKYKDIILYLIFGGLTTVVNFIVYFIMTDLFKVFEILSNGVAWFISVLFAYITNKLYVFESKTSTFRKMLKEFISFFLSRAFTGILFDILLFSLMFNVFKINDIVTKFIVQIVVIVSNYIFSKLIVFRKKTN